MSGKTMLSTNNMLGFYGFTGGQFSITNPSYNNLPAKAKIEFGKFEGKALVDTPEEFITAAYFSPIKIEDASALVAIEKELPQSDAKTAGLKLGAMWYKKVVETQFCDPGNAAQLANYELAMRTISERTGVSKDEMIAFYKAGIKDIVSEAVDREFNTINFTIDTAGKFYNTVLTRGTDNGYTLSYEKPHVIGSNKTITAASLDALLAEMAKSPDFNSACVDVVRANAELIPAVVFEKWAPLFVPPTDCLFLMKDALINFYKNSENKAAYDVLRVIYARYDIDRKNPLAVVIADCLSNTLVTLNPKLGKKYSDDVASQNSVAVAKQPLDKKYNPLFTSYGIGGGN